MMLFQRNRKEDTIMNNEVMNNEVTNVENNEMRICPPWVQYANAVNALFYYDEDIKVDYNDNSKELKLFVENGVKADALTKLLPEKKEFGNVTLNIAVVPADEEESSASLFRNAFSSNPVVSDVVVNSEMFSNPMTFVEFIPEVVQYWNDNLGDLHGNRTTVYEEVARDVFGELPGVLFCSEDLDE